MSYVDFLVELGSTGRILGRGLDAGPQDWSGLDPGHEESTTAYGDLCHFYGLIDVYFSRTEPEPWRCFLVMVRMVHRYRDETLCPAVRDRYGDAPDRLMLDDLARHAAHAGVELCRVDRHDDASLDRFWFPAGKVEVSVVAPHQAGDFPGHGVGEIYSVAVSDQVLEPEQLTPYRAGGG